MSEIFKIIIKNIVFKNMVKILEFSKTEIYVKEPCKVYMSTKFQVHILKNDRVLVEGRKQPFFTLFPAISVFSLC